MQMTMWDRLNPNEKSAMKAGNGWHDDILVVGKYLGIKNKRGNCEWKEVIDYDDTPTGHSFAAAWWTITGFGVLAGVLLIGLAGEAAIYNLFG